MPQAHSADIWTDVVTAMIEVIHRTRLSSVEKLCVFQDFIRLLDEEGWNTQRECVGLDPIFNVALQNVYGSNLRLLRSS
jgi:hypothetical protein